MLKTILFQFCAKFASVEIAQNGAWYTAPLIIYTAKTPQTCYKLLISPVATCQQVATKLSISSSCNKPVKIRFVVTCHLQTCYNLLKQLAASQMITSFDNQLATSLLTTCKRLVVNKLSQAIGLSSKSFAKYQQTCFNFCVFSRVHFLQVQLYTTCKRLSIHK